MRQHPWGWAVLIGAALLLLTWWWNKPLTWRNAEGPVVGDDGRRGFGASYWPDWLNVEWLRFWSR